jgi:hypothetical protein
MGSQFDELIQRYQTRRSLLQGLFLAHLAFPAMLLSCACLSQM